MVALDWTRIWSSMAMVEYIICFAIFLAIGFEFLRSNRTEARAVGIVFLGGCVKNLFTLLYHIVYDGVPTPSWVSALEQIPVIVTLIYLMYVIFSEAKARKGNGKNG